MDYLRVKQRDINKVTILDEDFCELDLSSPELNTINRENLQVIQKAINALPQKARLVFRLVKEDGLKYREVAELLGLSVKTIEAHMMVAYKKLFEYLEGDFPEYSSTKRGNRY